MVQSHPNSNHSLDIRTSVQAHRQEVGPKSREKRLKIWWPVHITHRILTTSHQPNNLIQHKHSHALKAVLALLPNMAPRKRALRADEDTSDSQPAAKRQETPHSGSGTRSKQPTTSHGSRTIEDSAQVAAATTTDPVQTRNSTTSESRTVEDSARVAAATTTNSIQTADSTTSESRPFSEDHVIKSQQ
jgi:hypothetical protein